jgi:CHAD domain-containing protein
MAEGKWIEDLRPEMSLPEAARHVLKVRLNVVREALPPALHEWERDPEHVHRLRVATRRADAALQIFRGCLPDKVFKAARRRLKRIRRAAGTARDWDVFLSDVVERRPGRKAAEQAGLDLLIGYASGQRAAAQRALEEAPGQKDPAFDHCPKETADAAAGNAGATFVELARPLLSSLVHRLEETARDDLSDYARLHQVRIAGKQLRYAMEVFARCFPAEFRVSVYARVEEMQEVLGRANDSHVAAGRLRELRDRLKAATPAEWKRVRGGVEGVLRSHDSRLARERRQFLAWWKHWSRGGAAELADLLREP